MDKDLTDDMFLQIRTAHRLIGAYFQRLMPLLDQVASELDLSFYQWDSLHIEACSTGGSNPFNLWSLALIPTYSPFFLFHSKGKKENKKHIARQGEYLICLAVINDTGVFQDHEVLELEEEPDILDIAISAEKSSSILRVALFTSCTNKDLHWEKDLWDGVDWPEFNDSPITTRPSKEVYGYTNGFEMPIADLVAEDGVDNLVEKIELFKIDLLKTAKENFVTIEIEENSKSNTEKA